MIQNFIPKGRPNRPGIKMTPKYITIHDTGNPTAGAENHGKYLASTLNKVSWHYTVDDYAIVQHLPIDEVGWHAGDGRGPGNMTSIGVELCENGDREKTENNAAELVANLVKQTGANIVQHNHWTGKNCPRILRSRPGGWEGFLKKVESYMSNVHVLEFSPNAYKFDVDTGTPGKLETVSQIAQMRNAHAGINLGFFDMSGKAEHYSLLMRNGKIENPPNFAMECWFKDGRLTVQDIQTNSQVPLDADWAVGLSFSLIIGGKKDIRNYERFPHYKNKEPRTAIGQKANGNIVLVAVDAPGMTADELADYMLSLGCIVAVNADGGGSTTMVKDGKVINKPEYGKERSVGSVLLVYPKAQPPAEEELAMQKLRAAGIVKNDHDFDSPVTWREHAITLARMLDKCSNVLDKRIG